MIDSKILPNLTIQYFLPERDALSGRPNRQIVLQAANEIIQRGAVGIRDAFKKEFIQELQIAYARKSGSAENEQQVTFQKVGHKRYMSAVRIEPPFSSPDFYANRSVLAIVKTLLGKSCKIDSFGAVCAYPGAEMQHIHRDHSSLFQSEEDCVQLPPYALQLVIPLIDVDMDAGPTALWEGSHRMLDVHDLISRLKKKPDLSNASFPSTKMGDCFLYDYRLVHAGLPNRSLRTRSIVYILYTRPWFHDAIEYGGLDNILISKSQYENIPVKYKDLFLDFRNKHHYMVAPE